MERSRPRTAPGFLGLLAREVAAYAWQGALLRHGPRRPDPSAEGPTVLFVHGHLSGPGSFLPLERSLAPLGYARFAAFQYPGSGTVEAAAERLAAFVETCAPAGPVAVVGHSMGGVLGRLWIQEHAGYLRTRAFVTLSSPHGGVPLPSPLRALPLVGELIPGGPLLRRLEAGRGKLTGIPCVSFVSSRDHFLLRPGWAAFEPAELVTLDHAGHAGLLFSAGVHRLVAERLLAAAPPPTRRPRSPEESAGAPS